MPDLHRILVVVDPTSDSEPAVERAAWLAAYAGASLELFICDYDQHLAGERFFDAADLAKTRAKLIQNHLAKLTELTKAIDQTKVTVSIDARWDHPLDDAIIRKAAESGADLLVKDTHYHAAIRRSLFSNTDWSLIRRSTIPLWLVKPRPMSSSPKIIAAVDPVHEHDKPAALDHDILDLATDVATLTGGTLSVFHGFDPAPAYAVSADSLAFPISAPISEIAEALKAKHVDAMDELLATHPEIHASSVKVLEGEIRELLVGLADQLGADLVVIGAVSRGAVKRLLLGSTAEQLLDYLPCDLLIVKPKPGDE